MTLFSLQEECFINVNCLFCSTLARHLFSVHDDPVLKYMRDDNQRIEPEWYIPIIPMVLVNGAEGIGTGWSTKIPNYNPREIVANIKRMLDGNDPEPMVSCGRCLGFVLGLFVGVPWRSGAFYTKIKSSLSIIKLNLMLKSIFKISFTNVLIKSTIGF